jgi:hypothetical protein
MESPAPDRLLMLRTILAVKLFAAVDDVQRAWLHKVAARPDPT